MQSRAVEMLVGLFVCLGIAAIFVLTYRVSDLANRTDASGYTVSAAFNDIGGLKTGAPVQMAGVRIGRVTDIKLDQTTFRAVATMQIAQRYKIPSDSDASVLTSGLLGDQYIGIGPGGAMDNMKDGDKFIITQSAVVLENLIGQFMTSFGSGSSDSGGGQGAAAGNNGDDLFGPPPNAPAANDSAKSSATQQPSTAPAPNGDAAKQSTSEPAAGDSQADTSKPSPTPDNQAEQAPSAKSKSKPDTETNKPAASNTMTPDTQPGAEQKQADGS